MTQKINPNMEVNAVSPMRKREFRYREVEIIRFIPDFERLAFVVLVIILSLDELNNLKVSLYVSRVFFFPY
jgi:hypothetical protein